MRSEEMESQGKTTYTFDELSICTGDDKELYLEYVINCNKFVGGIWSCLGERRILFKNEATNKQVEVLKIDGKLFSCEIVEEKYISIEIPDRFDVYSQIQS